MKVKGIIEVGDAVESGLSIEVASDDPKKVERALKAIAKAALDAGAKFDCAVNVYGKKNAHYRNKG